MPNIGGHEVAKAIRRSGNPDAKSIPIIAMRADALGEDMKKSATSGMNACAAMPINPERLSESLVHYLRPAKTI